ncbi:hypothetical protein ACP3WI_24735, partial [Salmonella enterica]|uniref:hypothetical protein n=1 Tax=Salmonella enterica TaxID=28901 RepID=UPI003CF1BA50
MGIVNPFWKPDTAPHVENKFPVITSNEDSVKITIDISVLGWGYWGAFSTGRFIILAENGSSRLAFNPNSGSFEEFDNQASS